MYTTTRIRIMGVFLCFAFILGTAGTAMAVTDVYLRAEATILNLPDGAGGIVAVPAWGFAQDTAFGASDGQVSVPGPVLRVPPGETLLRVHMDNNLPEPISMNINGLLLANNSGPVFSELGDATVYASGRPTGNFTARVRSFGHETPSNNATAVIYEFNLKPGTYLYTSGTNPAKQVQMGLYGALAVDQAPGVAYTGVPYTNDVVLVYSEVDPAMNAAIDAGTYGPGGTITSSLHRNTKYFLINGIAYDPTAPNGGGLDPVAFIEPYDTALVRVLNAGYETHVPQLLNMYVSMVAEDGNPYAYPRQQHGFELAAGKTIDAVMEPLTAGAGRYSIHDAAHWLTNNGGETPGGMLAYYAVGCVGDVDHSGAVNFGDLALLRANFGNPCTPGTPCEGDINKDGSVNFGDLALLRSNFGASAGCPAAP